MHLLAIDNAQISPIYPCAIQVGNLEIDFIAESGSDRIYYQICASILDLTTFAREIEPLKKANDHFPKFILSMDELPMDEDGIKQINILDFLLDHFHHS